MFVVFLTTPGFSQLKEIPKQQIPEEYGYIVKIGQQMPRISYELTDGTIVTPEDLKNKVVMLQFTASWCGVCRKEMPFIEDEIWLKLKDRSDFALYGIDRDEPLATVQDFKKNFKVIYQR